MKLRKIKTKKMNKKAQDFGIVTFVGMVLVLLFLAPILLKIVRSTTGGFSDAINSTDAEAAKRVDLTSSKFVQFWDYMIVIVFGINVLLMLISAFFIDTHPAFMILYIFVTFLTAVFAPEVLDSANKVWATPQFSEETGIYLSLTGFLLENFGSLLLGVIILTGIIIYAKIKFFGREYG